MPEKSSGSFDTAKKRTYSAGKDMPGTWKFFCSGLA
jgi:hypothetical protein